MTELELKQKELALKERELNLKEKELDINLKIAILEFFKNDDWNKILPVRNCNHETDYFDYIYSKISKLNQSFSTL